VFIAEWLKYLSCVLVSRPVLIQLTLSRLRRVSAHKTLHKRPVYPYTPHTHTHRTQNTTPGDPPSYINTTVNTALGKFRMFSFLCCTSSLILTGRI
jgi:hypothetical protein